MLSSLVAVVAIIGFVLPGFIVSRVAAGRRAQPASITDLELVLRSLGYALVVHAFFIATTWTTSLIDKVRDAGTDWARYRWELIAFGGSVLIFAFVLGLAVGAALRALEGSPTPTPGMRGALRTATFHALGGQDARDAFDYVLERRRERDEKFIIVVRVDAPQEGDDGLRVGLYGSRSYFGLSPRPHDLYLEEVWEFAGRGRLKRKEPTHEAWFPANGIKDLWFRPIAPAEIQRGEVRDFRSRTLSEAVDLDRARLINEILAAAQQVSDATPRGVADAVEQMHTRHDELEAADAGYADWKEWREDILAAAAIAVAVVTAADSEFDNGPYIHNSIRTRMRPISSAQPDWDQWLLNIDYFIAKLESAEADTKFVLLDLTAWLAAGMWRVDGFEPEWFHDPDPQAAEDAGSPPAVI